MKTLAFNLASINRLEDAEIMIRKALMISEITFPEKPDSDILTVLAFVLYSKGSYEEAESCKSNSSMITLMR